ncbi:bacteriorhodopsin [Natronobacterium texcoconense]|uniref:Bacteriorhodopsin-like protein n=1 Tax=Natronobacterium texcoconense TaxID=1095778 RepID=A0A1H1FPA2_NATTX|nr:bacteriorhodopsin [Natronobacterium texcoconense]SDR02741.1 Bacteriorhodopsin-like protein [Natronobacterium texcoconense]
MFAPSTVYLWAAAGLGVATLAFLVVARRLPDTSRQFGYAAVGAVAVMTASNVVMAGLEAGGYGTDFVRFVGYTGLWTVICSVIVAVAGVDRRLTGALFAIVLSRLWITYGSWQVEGTLGAVLALVPFALLLIGIYLLFGPFMRAVSTVEEERRLLYTKLRNLVVLGWIALVLTGILSESMDLTTDFVGQFASIYVEVVLVIGFAGIVVRSGHALEKTAASTSLNPFEDDRTGDPRPESVAAD